MKVYNTFSECEKIAPRGRVITIGNFDGCHLGHQRLISKTRECAALMGLESMAVTFNPHPKAFFSPEILADHLYSQGQKERLLCEFGLSELLIQKFDSDFSRMSHDDYYEKVLKTGLQARALTIGDNFRFGYKRLGDNRYLEQKALHDGISIHVEPPESFEEETISSSRIRRVLRVGQVEAAAKMLGRPYTIEGTIVQGAKLGRSIGIPTANLGPIDQLLPARGVYAAYVKVTSADPAQPLPSLSLLPREKMAAVVNIGVRPTLRDNREELKIEAHILSAEIAPDTLYGHHMAIYLTNRLRDEQKFESLDQLKTQIHHDILAARHVLS